MSDKTPEEIDKQYMDEIREQTAKGSNAISELGIIQLMATGTCYMKDGVVISQEEIDKLIPEDNEL